MMRDLRLTRVKNGGPRESRDKKTQCLRMPMPQRGRWVARLQSGSSILKRSKKPLRKLQAACAPSPMRTGAPKGWRAGKRAAMAANRTVCRRRAWLSGQRACQKTFGTPCENGRPSYEQGVAEHDGRLELEGRFVSRVPSCAAIAYLENGKAFRVSWVFHVPNSQRFAGKRNAAGFPGRISRSPCFRFCACQRRPARFREGRSRPSIPWSRASWKALLPAPIR